MAPAVPTAHTLTVEFGRVLSEAEWRQVMTAARQIPYARGFRVDAVQALPHVKGT